MSTVAEHIATLEMYKANGQHELFHQHAFLFMQVHYHELAGLIPTADIKAARISVEAGLMAEHGEKAKAYIDAWHAALKDRA